MNKSLITVNVVLSIFIIFALSVPLLSTQKKKVAHEDLSLLGALNPDWIRYAEARKKGVLQQQEILGYVPAPVTVSHIRGKIDPTLSTVYPETFDLRDANLTTYLKNQGDFYTCWAISAYASLESCLLPDEIVDFSEWHLARQNGFDYYYGAGNSWVTTAYLTRWSGPVSESLAPYPSDENEYIPDEILPPARHVQQVIFLPERTGPLDNDTIKYFLMNEGPVDVAVAFDYQNYSSQHSSIYSDEDCIQNHRVTIVGWIDDFPASNFIVTPPGNGAWIARNSYGYIWGDNGHFYLSYYDLNMEEATVFSNAEPITNYETIYQYDPYGWIASWGTLDSWGGNVFTASSNRALTAVGFYVNDANAAYEVSIYKNVAISTGNPTDGQLAITQSGSHIYAGYYTVVLNHSVPLTQGETFSVIVRFVNSQRQHSVPIERPLGYNSSKASANPGESFVSTDGIDWQDLTQLVAFSNVCVKAYTEFPEVEIDLRTERRELNAWLVSRYFGDIYFNIVNYQEVSMTRIAINRRTSTTDYVQLISITPDQLSQGEYRFEDRYLDPVTRYTYQVVIYDQNDQITGRSPENVID